MSVITLDTVLHNQISGYPTKASVAAKLEAYQQIVNKVGGKYPSGIQLLDGGGVSIGVPVTGSVLEGARISRNDLTVGMLTEFAKVHDYKFPKELQDGLTGLDAKFSFNLTDSGISEWVNRGSDLMNVSLATSGQIQGYGMQAISLGTMTFEAARSGGYVSDKELSSIAMNAGATAGGIIGTIFPGIGTAIGSLIGSAVGALVGKILGAFTKPPFKKTLKEMKKEAKKALVDLKLYCGELEGELNDYIFKRVFEISTEWVNAEMSLGYRFPLRWFDANPGLRFEGPAMGFKPFLDKIAAGDRDPTPKTLMAGYSYPHGKFHCIENFRARQAQLMYGGKNFRAYGSERRGYCNFYCPEKILGCLYPPLSINTFHGYGSPRVAAAFFSRGFSIPANLGCADLKAVNAHCEDLPGWDQKGKAGEAANEECKTKTFDLIENSFVQVQRKAQMRAEIFDITAKLISTDLIRTSSLMQAKQSILMNRVGLEGTGVVTDVALRFAGERNKHIKNMKRLSLYGGAGLLGFAVFRGMR